MFQGDNPNTMDHQSVEGMVGSVVAAPQPSPFPIVGIGASAGGLAAFEAFFSGMPVDQDPGMAFVLVQHLAPDRKSILSELIRRYTRMPVFEVEEGMKVQANCTYVIPPNHYMALQNGSLHLLEPVASRDQRWPIDYFFASLAAGQRERAIGIVLSGTGSDGTSGVRAIKEAGGMVMAQIISSCEFGGMPGSAIATGLVDYQLPPKQMPLQLLSHVARGGRGLPRTEGLPIPKTEGALNSVFLLLRAQMAHDFSQYKPSIIHRRIDRRMVALQIDNFDSYVAYLQQTPKEVQALFCDLLIGVTNFFRDTRAFEVLEEQVIPKLFAGKPAGMPVRVWSAGCSTGEEAYSLAILLVERMEALKQNYILQVFATDIDSSAISTARAGQYPASIAADVSAERLARFFVLEPGGRTYRIHKRIRDLLVFSEQDLIRDPPFSKLDLISCRNLLIYLGADLQKRLMPLFHYALKPGGMLFLGSSEGVGEFDSLFAVLDQKAKVYTRREGLEDVRRADIGTFFTPVHTMMNTPLSNDAAHKYAISKKPPLRELTEQAILRQLAPACALVNAQGDLLYLHGRTGTYLEPSPGEVGVQNILKMAREGLRSGLSSALQQAVGTQRTASASNLHVLSNGHFARVHLGVHPVARTGHAKSDVPLYLVMLEEASDLPAVHSSEAEQAQGTHLPDTEDRIQSLLQELRAKDECLQSAQELVESSTEELKDSKEEMQAVNEELQSSNEELQTSTEELQSVNEELATVNAELEVKVVDLSRANDDMNNLLAGTGVGTLFVDQKLRIMRFTPVIGEIIHLIDTDIGRPVAHFAANLPGYTDLVADVQNVLDTLTPVETEVRAQNDRWYNLRIQPYRTLNNVIEGAVLSLVDITTLKRSEESLRSVTTALQRMAVVVRDASDAITLQDLEGRTMAWNPGAVRLYGWSETQALQMNVRERIPEALREGELAKLVKLSHAKVLEPYLTERITQSGVVVHVSIIATALLREDGQVYAVATTERVIPDGKP